MKVRSIFTNLQCTKILSLGMSEYGGVNRERFLIKFVDALGNDIIWFTSADTKFDPGEGETYDVKATPTKHQIYNGVRQTVVSRVSELRNDE